MESKAKPQCFVFDIDGTLADSQWRTCLIKQKPKNWKGFVACAKYDLPIRAVYQLYKALTQSSVSIAIITGRSEEDFDVTNDWLNNWGITASFFRMRAAGDKREDFVVKGELMDKIQEQYDVVGIFEDRKQCCDEWNRRGIFCFDVGQGKGDF